MAWSNEPSSSAICALSFFAAVFRSSVGWYLVLIADQQEGRIADELLNPESYLGCAAQGRWRPVEERLGSMRGIHERVAGGQARQGTDIGRGADAPGSCPRGLRPQPPVRSDPHPAAARPPSPGGRGSRDPASLRRSRWGCAATRVENPACWAGVGMRLAGNFRGSLPGAPRFAPAIAASAPSQDGETVCLCLITIIAKNTCLLAAVRLRRRRQPAHCRRTVSTSHRASSFREGPAGGASGPEILVEP